MTQPVDLDTLESDASAANAHITNTSNPHSVTKTQVGLGNVDNTSDVNKPISTATQTALDGKVEEAPEDGKQYAREDGTWVEVTGGG